MHRMKKAGRAIKIRFKYMILSSKNLKDELLVAFGLILLTILVLVGYLFPGVASVFEIRSTLHLIIVIITMITIIGFMIILQIVEPVIKISREAKKIAEGDLDREIELAREDEIGELGRSLNQMTAKIRDSVGQLKELRHTSESLNREINDRIASLSNLMDISNLIAQNAPLEEVLDLAVHKCLALKNMTLGCVILKEGKSDGFRVRCLEGPTGEALAGKGLRDMVVQLGEGLLGKAILRQKALVIDERTTTKREVEDFKGQVGVRNAVIAPVSTKGNAYGLLIAGNEQDGYICPDIERELLQLVAKHIAIAILNNMLSRQVEQYEVTDGLTGLFNNSYARQKLEKEVKQAVDCQKTCSFVLFSLDRFHGFEETFGHIDTEEALLKVTAVIKEGLGKEDRAARFAEDEFALILPGRNKKESIQIAEKIRQKIQQAFEKEEDTRKRLTVTSAVVENPIDGATAEELILKSGCLLADCGEKGGNRVGYQG